MGQKPAGTAFQAADYTIRIMLRTLRQCGAKVIPSNSRARRRQTSGPLQGPPASRPVRGPRTLRSLVSASVDIPAALHPPAAQPPATSALMLVSEDSRYSWAQSATTRTVINLRRPGARWQPQCSASSPPPYAPPVLGRLSQLLLLPGQATSRRVTACGSAVRSACLSPAAIPPHLCRDESRQKCSGQPGYGRPGRWRRHCRIPLPLHPPKTAPERWCLALPSTSCCYSTVGDGPFRPRPRRPSAFPHRRSLPLLQGA